MPTRHELVVVKTHHAQNVPGRNLWAFAKRNNKPYQVLHWTRTVKICAHLGCGARCDDRKSF
ncbi:4626_t:CDS:2, partial [Funneliformis caledonium]